MATQLTSKQPAEAYAVSFDFTAYLGAETVATATITATDTATLADVSTTVLDVAQQSIVTPIVYAWVRAGTTGHNYLITCRIVGSLGSIYELDGILPVLEDQGPGTASGGGWSMVTAPVIEPITLAQAKEHLGMSSGTLAGNLTTYQSILPGSHGISAGGLYTHVGAWISVIGKETIVNQSPGIIGAGGTVDAKIQESDDAITGTDVTSGAFVQVTGASHLLQEKAYTGTKAYVRVVARVLVAACEFGADVIVNSGITAMDDLLTALIQASREHVENITRRALLTQTWDYSLDAWPCKGYIKLPGGNLQSVTSVKWKDTAGTETILTAGTDYLVETNGQMIGRIVLPYGASWTSGTLYPSNPVVVRFVAGWTAAANIPAAIIAACKLTLADLVVNREGQILSNLTYQENRAVKALLASYRLWDEF